MTGRMTLPVFSACGIELEYMIVDRESLAIRPLADRLLHALTDHPASTAERGMLGWSNELVRQLDRLAESFQNEVEDANRTLDLLGAQLMPTGMHPWMDPSLETVLWTQDNSAIYAAYDRIFGCSRHGFANLQSMHINLPFGSDAEFERLHAAVRLVLPFIPALAASSPLAEGRPTGFADYRLEVYRSNAGPLSTIAGDIVPDTATGRAQYEADVLAPMYREIAPLDPDGILQHEWLNSRGAIPRFDRNAIEIRVADTQECPRIDVAIAAIVVEVAKALYDERWSRLAEQQAIPTAALANAFRGAIRDAEAAVVDDAVLLRVIGLHEFPCTMRDVWAHWLKAAEADQPRGQHAWWQPAIKDILDEGTLSGRISSALDGVSARDRERAPDGPVEMERIRKVYAQLCRCLAESRMFHVPPAPGTVVAMPDTDRAEASSRLGRRSVRRNAGRRNASGGPLKPRSGAR